MKLNINSVEVHPQLRKKRISSGWCAGWVLVHCGLKIDPPVCKQNRLSFYHFTCRFRSFLSPACPGRSGSCKYCLGNAGGIPLGSRLEGGYFRNSLLPWSYPTRKLSMVPSHWEEFPKPKNFGWYPATWYHGKKILPSYYGF